MDTSTKLSKHFLKLADGIKANKNDRKDQLKCINIKDNVVYSSNGKILLRCVLDTDNMPVYNLNDGYYDIIGNYIIRNDDFTNDWNYPDVDRIMDCTFKKTFVIGWEKTYNLFCFTLSANGILMDYAKYDKQLKQLFSKADEIQVYFNKLDQTFMLKCQYPVCDINDIKTEIQLFLMPMKHDDVPEIKDCTYNPTSNIRWA